VNIGACREGLSPCRGGRWDACEDAVVPAEELCATGKDEDCDGETDEIGCTTAGTLPPPPESTGCGCGGGAGPGAGIALVACVALLWRRRSHRAHRAARR
jgi:hypothetical protein